MSYTYRHARPALTVDCVVFGADERSLQVLLIQRNLAPHRGWWALPGGFVGIEETLDEAAKRELREETGLANVYLEQLYTFGKVDRDPRERVVSVAYYALVKPADYELVASTDASHVQWFEFHELPPLAFDHREIVELALQRLQGKVRYQPIGFELLPPRFTLTQLQRLYEVILERPLDKRNFRKKVLEMDLLEPLDEYQSGVAHRRARLYRFARRRYRQLVRQGFLFEL